MNMCANFTETLRQTIEERLKKEKRIYDEEMARVAKNNEEWEVVENFIKNTILEEASKPYELDRNRVRLSGYTGTWIVVDFYNTKIPEGSSLEEILKKNDERGIYPKIHPMDVDRFCKENKLTYLCGLWYTYSEIRLNHHEIVISKNPYLKLRNYRSLYGPPIVTFYCIKNPIKLD